MFYNTATTAGKKYASFQGREKIAVPYGIELTHDNQVNIKSVDFQQLNDNYLRVRNRDPFKTLWKSPDEFTQDSHTYFTNHKEGQPGATGIGEQKRDAINSLAGFGTQMQREANPLVGTLPSSVRPIVKSYRIDRANQISATGAMRPFISEAQYYAANRNYLPRVSFEADTEQFKSIYDQLVQKAFGLNPHPERVVPVLSSPEMLQLQGARGLYFEAGQHYPGAIHVDTTQQQKGYAALTFVHELMHAQDFEDLSRNRTMPGSIETDLAQRLAQQRGGQLASGDAMDRFLNTVKNSDHIKAIENRQLNARNRGDKEYFQYLQRPTEMTARAFTQYAVQKTNDPDLISAFRNQAQLGSIDRWGFWPHEEFNQKIAPAIEAVLREKNLLPSTAPAAGQ